MITIRNNWLIGSFLLMFCLQSFAQKPNIILIYTDDMGMGDVSYTGGEVCPTPNIDSLAKGGKVLTQYYTTAPVCSPSRVAVTTGTYHIKWNINTFLSSKKFNRKCMQSDFLKSEAPTVAKVLKEAGYKTAHFGKWHMGGGRDVKNAPAITAYGFDEYISTWESPDPDPLLTSGNWIWKPEDSIKRWNRTAYFVDKSLDFLAQNPSSPCYINLWPDDVHSPWVPNEQVQGAGRKEWFKLPPLKEVLADFDKEIGRLIQGLKDLGMYENTLIIFTSDNGPAPSFTRVRTNGLRGIKNSLYEGGINMPCIVHWPKEIEAGQIDSVSQIASIDWLPTFAQITDAKLPKDFSFDGEGVQKLFYKQKPYKRKRELFFEYGRNESYNYPKDTLDRSLQLALRDENWKCFTNQDGTEIELYNLSQDPTESQNLANEFPRKAEKMKVKLMEWYRLNDKKYVR